MSTVKQKKRLTFWHVWIETCKRQGMRDANKNMGDNQHRWKNWDSSSSPSMFTCSREQVHQVIAAQRGILPNNGVDLMKGPEPSAVSKSWRLARQWGADKMHCTVLSYLALSGLVSWRLKAFHNCKTTLEHSCSLDSHLQRKRKNHESLSHPWRDSLWYGIISVV